MASAAAKLSVVSGGTNFPSPLKKKMSKNKKNSARINFLVARFAVTPAL
jgi:hypothetical protein